MICPFTVPRLFFLFIALAFVAPADARQTAYDNVGDHYPKNEGIDIQKYAFEIRLTDHSDEIQVAATVDARFTAAGQREHRLDLVKQADTLESKGMHVDHRWPSPGDSVRSSTSTGRPDGSR
jgi:hypothetical protein